MVNGAQFGVDGDRVTEAVLVAHMTHNERPPVRAIVIDEHHRTATTIAVNFCYETAPSIDSSQIQKTNHGGALGGGSESNFLAHSGKRMA